MATRVWESAIVGASIGSVWGVIRPLSFAYHPNVASAEVEDKKTASEVGAVVRVTYRDATVQQLKVVELSDAAYTVSWELVGSTPPLTVSGVTHTIKLRRITDVNQTFIEWTTDFSKDAGQDVLQDQRFKQQDHFNHLSASLERKPAAATTTTGAAPTTAAATTTSTTETKETKRTVAPSKRIIGGFSGVYNPAKAREGVITIWTELQALQKAAGEHETLNAPSLVALTTRYKKLPITWQIDWAVADLSADNGLRVADDIRTKLNAAKVRLGDNSPPLPRLFNAGA